MRGKLIKLHSDDNIAIALVDLRKGESISFEGEEVLVLSDTQAKHKITMVDFALDDKIYIYGVLVAKATTPINRGDVLTVDNINHQSNPTFQKTELPPGMHRIFPSGKTVPFCAIIGRTDR